MKKALILTASFGGGHNRASNNIKEKLVKRGFEVEEIDLLKEISEKLDSLLVGGYLGIVTKTPEIYGLIYKGTNLTTHQNVFSKPILNILSSKILPILEEKKPNVVIGTHVFAIGVMEHIKQKEYYDVPFISVITDYVTHKMYFSDYVDYYIVASEFTKNKMIEDGIKKEKICAFGIPIDDSFKIRHYEKKDGFNILTVFGSLGIDDFSDYIMPILDIAKDVKLTMVCGRNEELKEKLEKKYSLFIDENRLEVLGYTNEIARLMEENQILVTKPGGLTVTEAIVKNIPLIIPFFIPGHEEENKNFIVEEEIGVYAEGVESVVKEIKKFYKNRRRVEYMALNMKEIAEGFSVDKIAELVEKII
ncbi:MGDG synthase family glycosyltransferase [Parvimonas parva]|uniref:Galactosyldiacylglycerol synthase n=1 Tax=Parvimonas parva TaxID=2769485 RepID=A0ABS1C913_9FIRM|nr:glycosyltransferase [Parvimonas parva]MBK1468545.1 hypothetical protein [Parvimonas parva]